MWVVDHELLSTTNIYGTTYSNAQPVPHLYGFSMQVVYTMSASTADATLILQASCDGTNWADIEDSSVTITDTSGCIVYNVQDAFYAYTRLKITPGAGTITTLTARTYAKGA